MDALEVLSESESGGCEGCAPSSTTEVRDYKLNEQTALKEKLKSTEEKIFQSFKQEAASNSCLVQVCMN